METAMSAETFLQTIIETVWAYVEQFLPSDLAALVQGNDAIGWILAAVVLIGAALLVSQLVGD
jgi:hypothetical protein